MSPVSYFACGLLSSKSRKSRTCRNGRLRGCCSRVVGRRSCQILGRRCRSYSILSETTSTQNTSLLLAGKNNLSISIFELYFEILIFVSEMDAEISELKRTLEVTKRDLIKANQDLAMAKSKLMEGDSPWMARIIYRCTMYCCSKIHCLSLILIVDNARLRYQTAELQEQVLTVQSGIKTLNGSQRIIMEHMGVGVEAPQFPLKTKEDVEMMGGKMKESAPYQSLVVSQFLSTFSVQINNYNFYSLIGDFIQLKAMKRAASKDALRDLIGDAALDGYTLSKAHQNMNGVQRNLANLSPFFRTWEGKFARSGFCFPV